MYKLLLVDDERIIREGIAQIVSWNQEGFALCGAAQNGLEALEMIRRDPPHLVITDLKMPALDGLALIARVKEEFPEILFIVISGFGEFELAKEAMRYGVKHYLLKPCNERKILEVLHEVKGEITQREEKERFIQSNRENFTRVLPLVKEQFIRDYITNRNYSPEEAAYYCQLLNIAAKDVRMILFQPEGDYGYEELFGLIKILDETLTNQGYFRTIIKNQILALVEPMPDELLLSLVRQVKMNLKFFQDLEVTVAYGATRRFQDAPHSYREVQDCLRYSFYLGEGSIISPRDIAQTGSPGNPGNPGNPHHLGLNYDALALAVKGGDGETAATEIKKVFSVLKDQKWEMNIMKTYALEVLMVIIRQGDEDEFERHSATIMALPNLKSLEQIQRMILETGCRLATANNERILRTHNKLARSVMDYVEHHFANEQLSLKWLAGQVMFMNDNYLSKLFMKETGEKFSHYLMRVRMEKAKELIGKYESDRVCEVAEKVGLGNNPQYFSQLFKKYTGLSPSEFKQASVKKM